MKGGGGRGVCGQERREESEERAQRSSSPMVAVKVAVSVVFFEEAFVTSSLEKGLGSTLAGGLASEEDDDNAGGVELMGEDGPVGFDCSFSRSGSFSSSGG